MKNSFFTILALVSVTIYRGSGKPLLIYNKWDGILKAIINDSLAYYLTK